MNRKLASGIGIVSAVFVAAISATAQSPATALPVPGFHHVHLNSPNPSAAIAEYILAYPSNVKVTVGGLDGFKTTNDVYFLFTKVNTPPPAAITDRISARTPQTAFWHFLFPVNTKDLRQTLQRFKSELPNFQSRLLPLYTGPDGKTVEMSGDTLPGFLTVAQMEEARAKGVKPSGNGGYFTWVGPDGVIMETAPGAAEKLTNFAMFEDQPYCANLWYQRHLNAPPPRGQDPNATPRTEANCAIAKSAVVSYPSAYKRGHVRVPPAMGVNFSDVYVRWYMNQEDTPLAPMRGGVVDHFALSVQDLDAWIAKLRSENIKFLEGPKPYKVGTMRAIMIEGPSKEAIELIEVKN